MLWSYFSYFHIGIICFAIIQICSFMNILVKAILLIVGKITLLIANLHLNKTFFRNLVVQKCNDRYEIRWRFCVLKYELFLYVVFWNFGPPTFGRKGSYKITPVVSSPHFFSKTAKPHKISKLTRRFFWKKFLISDYRGWSVDNDVSEVFAKAPLKIILIFCMIMEGNEMHYLSKIAIFRKFMKWD